MNILLVEDEERIADFLVRGLKAEGYSITHAPTGEMALNLLKSDSFNAVLLDVMLPGISGHEVCSKMRFRKDFTPVMMLTALDDNQEMIEGLRKGADDYLTKPFDFEELLARLGAMTRRNSDYADNARTIKCTIEVDSAAQCAKVYGETIELSSKELEILSLLINNRNRVISRERILNTVWGTTTDPLTNTVDVHIGRLRKKLGDAGKLISTVHGKGYRLILEES